jgi:hypothetical protein
VRPLLAIQFMLHLCACVRACVLTLHGPGCLCVSGPVVFLLLAAVVADGRLLLAARAAGVDVLHGALGEVCVTPYVQVPLRPGTNTQVEEAF